MTKNFKQEGDQFLTTAQAADLLNISVSTLKKFIYQGRIKTLQTPGGHYRLRKKDLLEKLYR
jgi:excisionase family DNA binding protein